MASIGRKIQDRIRYRLIDKKIRYLSLSNIKQTTKEVLEILNGDIITLSNITHATNEAFEVLEEEIIYKKTPSIIEKIVSKTDNLYRHAAFAELVKELYSSYQNSPLSKERDLFDVIQGPIKRLQIHNRSDSEECIAKLKVFLPLDAGFSTRFLHSLICHCWENGNVHFLEVATFLIGEGANPFQAIKDTTFFGLFLKRFGPDLNDTLLPSVVAFLEDILKSEGILNDVLKAVPISIFEGYSSQSSAVQELILECCLKMIEANPSVCDEVDDEGRTPLHKLIDKFSTDGLWICIPVNVAGSDSFWNLMSQLITEKNVNARDKDQVTPYSRILLWQESLMFHDILDKQKLIKKIVEIKRRFQAKGAIEEDATPGLSTLREREMESLLMRLIKFYKLTDDQLIGSGGKTSEEIIAELKKDVGMSMERIQDLKSKGCGKYITQLTRRDDLKDIVMDHTYIRNDRILWITGVILQVIIVENNAQEIYSMLLELKRASEKINKKMNYYAVFDEIKWCLDKGAHPTVDEIHEISLLNVTECKTFEAQLAVVNTLDKLIGAVRKQGYTAPIKLYLNPLQDQWNVREGLRTAAGAVIRAAYGTLGNCMKSKSVMNILLFISKDDSDDDIKKCFKEVDALLRKDMRDPPVTKWAKERRKYVEQYSEKQKQKQEKELRWALVKRNDNWLRRNVLHLAAIFCHDHQILKSIPETLIMSYINEGDLNGCSPLQIAHMHGNLSAVNFLKSYDERICQDNWRKLQSDRDAQYQNYCFGIWEMESSVLKSIKKMLVLPIDECVAIENNLKELFTRMVGKDGFLNAEIVTAGSVNEKLKVGRWDEFDLQIRTKIIPYGRRVEDKFEFEAFACLKLHEYFIKKLAEVDKEGISLQCISVDNPWTFIWGGEGACKGLEISVDVVPISVKDNALKEQDRQGLIIDGAPGYQPLQHLKWHSERMRPLWDDTICRHEWDILHNMPPGCRLGILIAKSLIEALYLTGESNLMKRGITSYVIKNSLLWLLAGRTPLDIEKHYGNVIGDRYGVLRQQLHFTTNDPKWMTEEDVERFAEEGRFWAENIFDVILFVTKDYKLTPGSFLDNRSNVTYGAFAEIDLLDTCGRCLEKLRPRVFFNEDACASSEGDTRLRMRLKEVTNKLNEKAQTVPGGRLWKMRKELKMLKIRTDELDAGIDSRNSGTKEYLERAERIRTKLDGEIGKLLLEYGSETQLAVLKKNERNCEELDAMIDNFIEELGHANRMESVLFRIKGEIEELERNSEPMGQEEREAALIRKRRECTELEKSVEMFRHDKQWHLNLEKLQKMVNVVSEIDSTPDDNIQEPIEDSLGDQVDVDSKNDAASADMGNTLNNNPSDQSDVLLGGELDIATMDRYSLLCGLPAPSALHLQEMSSDQVTSPVAPNESFTAIHFINNHYVVSCQLYGRVMLYDSLYDELRIQQVLPQLKCLYQIGSDVSNVEYIVPQSQGSTLDCGFFAAANATMLIHGIDPCAVTLDPALLHSHMDQCLRSETVELFPCRVITSENQDEELERQYERRFTASQSRSLYYAYNMWKLF